MSLTALALAGYIAWMLVLILLLEICRTHLVLVKGKAANSFAADGSDVFPMLGRITRAHANCYEHFPILGGALILSLLLDKTALTDPLAVWLIGARFLQSLIHIASGSILAAQARFAFFVVQQGIAIYWLILLVS